MSALASNPKKDNVNHYAESEGGRWDTEASDLLDPRVIEPPMYRARPGSDS